MSENRINDVLKGKDAEKLESNAKKNNTDTNLNKTLSEIRNILSKTEKKPTQQEIDSAKKFVLKLKDLGKGYESIKEGTKKETELKLGNLRDEFDIYKETREKLNVLLRQIQRDDKFDIIKTKGTTKQIQIIGENKNLDDIKNSSDILFLKKEGVDLAEMFLINEKNVKEKITSGTIKNGNEFIVNFGENESLNASIGAGDILPLEITKVRINGVEGIRKNNPRPGYYTEKGKYLPIFDGYKIEIAEKKDVNKLLGKEKKDWENFKNENDNEEAKIFRKIRINDTINNNGKKLSELKEDTDIIVEVQQEKERIAKWKEKIGKIGGKDISNINEFRISEQDFKNIANNRGLNEEDIPKVKAIMSAIGQQESRSNYLAIGEVLPSGEHSGDSAVGRYQIMPKNIIVWSNNYFGQLLDATPENQDKIAFAQICTYFVKYKSKGLSLENINVEISKDWYGRGRAQIAGHPTTRDYAKSVSKIKSHNA